MHIAQVAPLTEAIPPKLYGGTERVVSWLTEELIALGHEVTLFASGDSVTSARLEAVWPRALRLDGAVRDPNALHMMMLERVYRAASDFDFLHCHLDYYPILAVLATGNAVYDYAAWPARFAGAPAGVRHIFVGAGGVDLQFAAPALAAGELGANRLSRPAGNAAHAQASQAVLLRVPRPHCAGKRLRPRHSHRPALWRPTQSRGQGR